MSPGPNNGKRRRARDLSQESHASLSHIAYVGPVSEASKDEPREPSTLTAGDAERLNLRARLTTVFGWIAGGSLGLLVNYALFLAYGEGYPVTPTTFVLFLGGAFGGMSLADKLGPRGFTPLGIAAVVLLVAFAWVVLAGFLSY